MVLDALAAVLSGGLSTAQLDQQEEERNVSQVFIAFNLAGFDPSFVRSRDSGSWSCGRATAEMD
jgi:LDH2 family malate/lactate/ureidoglycolate dehydrogenase